MPRASGTQPLATPSLNLRPFKKRDAAALAKISSDDRTLKYFVTPPLDLRSAEDNISSWRLQYKNSNFLRWCLARAEDDLCVGQLDASIDEKRSSAELSYAVSPEHRGCGYAVEAVREVIGYLHGECDIHRIIAEINIENSSSARVAEKAGMELEGIHRDALTDRDGNYYDVAVYAHIAGAPPQAS